MVLPPTLTHLTSVLGWKAAGLSCGENFGTMSDGAEADGDGEDEAAEEGGVAESAAGTANRLRTRSRNYVDGDLEKK